MEVLFVNELDAQAKIRGGVKNSHVGAREVSLCRRCRVDWTKPMLVYKLPKLREAEAEAEASKVKKWLHEAKLEVEAGFVPNPGVRDQPSITFTQIRGGVHLNVRTCTHLYHVSQTAGWIAFKVGLWLGIYSTCLTQIRRGKSHES